MSEVQPTVEYREIKDFPAYRIGSDGIPWFFRSGKWHQLKPRPGKRGHIRVVLYPGYHRRLVHHLVLEAFIGPCPPGMECRHLDGNPMNNVLSNLCWGTRLENMVDRDLHGRTQRGDKHYKAKLTADKVQALRAECASGMSHRNAARKYGINRSTVSAAVSRKSWGHVP